MPRAVSAVLHQPGYEYLFSQAQNLDALLSQMLVSQLILASPIGEPVPTAIQFHGP
ncbi:MAG TPA: hypothetical protein VNH84_06245 [Candidatus Saccharimonadales bacterium]|nr:hypothetical protein [Candidatus Saccharimonadales bacterium]